MCNGAYYIQNWSNIRMLQWLIKELIKKHPSDAAELIKGFRIA